MNRRPAWLAVGTAFLKARQDQTFPDGLVLVESPYAGDVRQNRAYARAAVRDCFRRGEFPFASHLLFTQAGILKDGNPDERDRGIRAGLAWGKHAAATVVYTDLGITSGMARGIADANGRGRLVCLRRLGGRWDTREGGTRWTHAKVKALADLIMGYILPEPPKPGGIFEIPSDDCEYCGTYLAGGGLLSMCPSCGAPVRRRPAARRGGDFVKLGDIYGAEILKMPANRIVKG